MPSVVTGEAPLINLHGDVILHHRSRWGRVMVYTRVLRALHHRGSLQD
jgi:hypothetical protein